MIDDIFASPGSADPGILLIDCSVVNTGGQSSSRTTTMWPRSGAQQLASGRSCNGLQRMIRSIHSTVSLNVRQLRSELQIYNPISNILLYPINLAADRPNSRPDTIRMLMELANLSGDHSAATKLLRRIEDDVAHEATGSGRSTLIHMSEISVA